MKLKYQLFLVLLFSSVLLIALMLTANSISFHRQFTSYVNAVQAKRLEPLIKELAELHDEHAGWQWIDKHSWRDLLRKHGVHTRAGRALAPMKRKKNQAPVSSGRKRPPPKLPGPWLTLADKDRSAVIGPPTKQSPMQWIPIENADEQIGFLGFVRHKQFSRELDREFARQQRRNSIYAALAMLALCALIAAPLAARIIRPVTAVNKAIHALSHGEYDYRTRINRRDELGDLAKNINRLGDTLEQNKAARQRWIAEISHELRTPVAVLRAEVEAIQDGIRVANAETVTSLHAEIIRLSRLIDDLHQLSVSDLGALDYRMETLDAGTLIGAFFASHEHRLKAAEIALTLKLKTALVQGDRQRLFQLLENLLQNTVRYTAAPGSLEVTVSNDGANVRLLWSDSSPGVSDVDLQHLFEPLYRAEKSRNRKTSGSGLGLSIAHKIVHAHGGTLHATHSPLGGLTLEITLPVTT
jgi:two-component system sensor histidine kinase BaeS